MLPSPADNGQGRRDLPGEQREALDGQGAGGGMLAAPLAESLAVIPGPSVGLLQASVKAGGCFARPLPLDLTCAAVARSCFREAVEELGLPALNLTSPWHGYTLDDWTDTWEQYAQRTVAGDWEQSGKETLLRQRKGLMPETPVRPGSNSED